MTYDSPATYFLHQTLTKINGKPMYKKLKIIYDQIKANARSVPSDLGGGAQGLLGLIMTAAQYILIPRTVAFIRPANPGPLVIAAGTTQHETARLRYEHGENIQKYCEVVKCETILKNMIVEAIEPKYLKTFKNRDTGAIDMPIHTLLAAAVIIILLVFALKKILCVRACVSMILCMAQVCKKTGLKVSPIVV